MFTYLTHLLFVFFASNGSIEPIASCQVQATVTKIQETAATSLTVQLKITQATGSCDFIKKGKHIDAHTDLTMLKAGDQLLAQTGASSSMGPNGAVPFISWSQVKVTNREAHLPTNASLQSGTKFY